MMPDQPADLIISPDTLRPKRLPPGQQALDKLPVLHEGSPPPFSRQNWKFSVTGLVEPARELSYDQMLSLPRSTVCSDVHCVEGWSKLDNLWEGFSSSVLKELTTINSEALYVMVHASGGYAANLSLEDFFAPDVIFAFKYNGALLTPDHGFPLRLVVPRLYFWKSAKWVTGVEFMRSDSQGYWETRGYHNRGNAWEEERYSGATE